MPSARACWWWKHRLRDHDLVSDINHPRKQTFSIPYLHQITMEDMLDLHDRRNYPGSHQGSGNLHTASQKVTSVFIDATFPLGVLDFLSVQKRGSLFLFICSSMVLVLGKSNLLNMFETVLVQLAWQDKLFQSLQCWCPWCQGLVDLDYPPRMDLLDLLWQPKLIVHLLQMLSAHLVLCHGGVSAHYLDARLPQTLWSIHLRSGDHPAT